MIEKEPYLISPERCKLECQNDSSVCGHINKCSHHKQLDTLASRRAATINKRCDVYHISPITKEIVKNIILHSIKTGFTCCYCREQLKLYSSKSDFRLAVSIDHIIPMAMGGTNSEDNLIVSCTRCNLVKGTMKEKHFKLFLKTLLDTGGRNEMLEWLEDAYQHAWAYKIERLKAEDVE